MKNVLTMAGNFALHAASSVSGGETLIPIVGLLKSDNSQQMQRLVMGSVEATAIGENRITELGDEYKGGAFIKDGIVTLDTGKTDCLIIDVKFTEDTSKKVQFLIPYRNANHEKGFAIHRLKISEADGFSPEDYDWITNAFFDGLESHPESEKILNGQYEDQAGECNSYFGDQNTEFSIDDFNKLKQAPFLIFFLVAAADGKVDKKELTEFIKVLSNPELLEDALMNRVITNIINDIPTMIADMASRELDYISELGILQNIADNNLSEDEANQFKISLFRIGKNIAEASGGFFGFGSKISKEEKAALAAIALCLGIKL